MAESAAPLLATLRAIVGEANVLTADADVAPYVTDARDRYHGRARAVVRPANSTEVAAVVRCCAEHGVPLVPQGGNTGLCGGATPHETGGEVVVSLSRLNRVRALDAENATLTVEAGMPLAAVQQAAEAAGLLFPLSLAAEGSCAIGGNLSTNAGGTAVLRYGNARELVLGLEVVLADGRIWDGLKGLRKDNTGYDVKQLFLGSEGTLGIITAAVLKLFPKPRTSVTALAAIADVAAADRVAGPLAPGARRPTHRLRAHFRRLRRARPRAVSRAPRSTARPRLVRADSSRRFGGGFTAGRATRGGACCRGRGPGGARRGDRELGTTGRGAVGAARAHTGSAAARRRQHQARHQPSGIANPGVPRAGAGALDAALHGVRYVVFGHLGDGNLHYNLAAPAGTDAGRFLEQYRPRQSHRLRPGRGIRRQLQRRAWGGRC